MARSLGGAALPTITWALALQLPAWRRHRWETGTRLKRVFGQNLLVAYGLLARGYICLSSDLLLHML